MMRRRESRLRPADERGSGTVYVLGLVVLLLGLGVAVASLSGLVVAKHRAAAAADLAAVAAASVPAEACAIAADVARRNGTDLVDCVVVGQVVEVVVGVAARTPWRAEIGVEARARAGPATTAAPAPSSAVQR
ncbi:MAG TPA: Rv3654c family TadE-like protein [Nocardioidaceae bacterium]|jgi:secretion/DNA translocation related TadE-like protein|nr:pilus assembly protein TadG-related protein [Actinomycetota bacterium]HEV8056755.1 Rv3654c family TadE-like protein [Nocardioidaceae bacterium]